MARRLINLGGGFLAAVVAVGTAMYVRGEAPAFPYNAWGFNGLFALCVGYALLFGRRS